MLLGLFGRFFGSKSKSIVSTSQSSTHITILSWNLEDGLGASQVTRDEKVLAALQIEKPDVMCFSEVPHEGNLRQIQNWADHSLGGKWKVAVISGSVAGYDKLGILFDTVKFELVSATRHTEWIDQSQGGHRNPLSVVLRSKETGAELEVATIHPNRRNGDKRDQQFLWLAQYLNAAKRPVILVGDTNGDYNPRNGEGNPEFSKFLRAVNKKYMIAEFAGKTPEIGTCNQHFKTLLDLLIAPKGAEALVDYLFDEDRPSQCIEENSDHFPLIGVVKLK